MTVPIDMDNVIIAAVIVTVMFVSMRLLYGYWPWQRKYRRLTRNEIRKYAMQQMAEASRVEADRSNTGFNFQPVPANNEVEPDPTRPPPFPIFPAGSAAGHADHFDRGYNDNGTEKGEPGSQRSKPEGVAHPQTDDENKNKA